MGDVGAVESIISAIVGVFTYGLNLSRANNYSYDYIPSQLTGLGFVVGFGILLALVPIK